MRKLSLFFIVFTLAASLKAAVFTVTSNADAGAGTLRNAVTLANANGTAETDYIYFNLPGNSIADITIALESELPAITSNIVIDGQSQPSELLGNPNIRISLVRAVAAYFNGLNIHHASNVAVYGISFSNFKADPAGSIDEKKGGIYLKGSSNIIIGAPGKPNCFGNCYAGILSPFTTSREDIQNIEIAANIFGLSENGLNSVPNETGIDLSFLKNSIIGGDTPEYGNLIAANTRNGIALGAADGTITIANNIIGLDKSLNLKPSPAANGIYVNGSTSIPNITDNVIGGQLQGILVDYVNGGFIVARNRIGTGFLGTENFANGTGIHINFSNTKSIIGGTTTAETNYIAYNKTAILIENSYPISILKNSIYCNPEGAITFKGRTIDVAKIDVINAGQVSGKYAANAVVELFYTDECNDCQGKTWFATLNTDGAGNWLYTGAVTGKVTSLGTDANGATSNFSKPELNDANVLKQNVFCGEANGSIKGIKAYNASVFQWYNLAGELVGTSNDLENVGAGTYYLKAGQLGACDVKSANFTISAGGNGIDDSKKKITDAVCGASNGSITNIGVANDLQKSWYNNAGNIIATGNDLVNVPAGTYFFKAGSGACEITSPVYTVNNQTKSYITKDVVITPTSCGNKNGSIEINGYQTDVPTRFSWLDEDGNEVATSENLSNVFPGVYTLMASDANGCVNEAGSFTVAEADLPVIDLTKMQTFTSCDGQTISITGVEVKGTTQPFRYRWVDQEKNLVYEGVTFIGLKADNYQLLVSDKYNCEVHSDFIDFRSLKREALVVPNSFSPNGDGINDSWVISAAENYPNAEFSIVNRHGERVFYSKGYVTPFDGTYRGKPLPTGVYYYLIDLKGECGKLSGSLTLMK